MKFNKKLFNWSAWITILITYVLPYQSQSSDGHSTYFGYPLSFLTILNRPINISLFMTENLDLLAFAIDVFVVYFVLNFANVHLGKVKSNKDMKKAKELND